MAVYTDVAAEDLAEFLKGYDIGELLSYKGIAEGVENSNFLVHTSKGAFILTLYEKRVAVDDLPYFLSLMAHLAVRGVNCDGVIRTLVSRGLVEECGTEPESGAFLYRTTTLFLEKLGMNSVNDLPPLAPFLPDDVEEIADANQ